MSPGKNWIHCEDLSGAAITSDASEQIERVFAAEDFLAIANEEELLDVRVTIHPDHVLEQKLVAKDDGWMSQSLVLKPAVGIEHVPRLTRGFWCSCLGATGLERCVN